MQKKLLPFIVLMGITISCTTWYQANYPLPSQKRLANLQDTTQPRIVWSEEELPLEKLYLISEMEMKLGNSHFHYQSARILKWADKQGLDIVCVMDHQTYQEYVGYREEQVESSLFVTMLNTALDNESQNETTTETVAVNRKINHYYLAGFLTEEGKPKVAQLVKKISLYRDSSSKPLVEGHFNWRQQISNVQGNMELWEDYIRFQPLHYRHSKSYLWRYAKDVDGRVYKRRKNYADYYASEKYQYVIERSGYVLFKDRHKEKRYWLQSQKKGRYQWPVSILDRKHEPLYLIKYHRIPFRNEMEANYQGPTGNENLSGLRAVIQFYEPSDVPEAWLYPSTRN